MALIDISTLQGKTVLLRLDLDVPIQDTVVTDHTRLLSVKPTLDLLQQATQIVIIGHLGRPKGTIVEALRLDPVAQALSHIIGEDVHYIPSLEHTEIKDALNQKKKWNLLENLRFHPGEEENRDAFAKQLAEYGELFVFDAFAVAHRAAASTVGIPQYLPSYAGLRVAMEVERLSSVLHNPEHPFLAIIGGAKIETKVPVIHRLIPIVDTIFIGGKLIHEIQEQHLSFDPNVIVGQVVASGLDITEDTQKQLTLLIKQAKLIIWNGPAGKFEDPSAQAGTRAIADALKTTDAKILIGGGETIAAARRFGVIDRIDFISVGGGAMLEFLSGKSLPALHALHMEEDSL